MTQRDVFESNADLIEHCARLLAEQPRTRLKVVRNGRRLKITTAGLDRIDIYADGHPAGSSRSLERKSAASVQLPAGTMNCEVVGFTDNVVRQRRRLFAK